jgi:two-component system sensor histidine kinase UhpB
MLGYSQAELKSRTIFEIIIPEELAYVRENIETLSKGSQLRPYIRYFLRKSGEVLPVENNTVLVRDVEGKPRFIQSIARDISDRIKAERAQVQLLEQIRQSNEQLRDLALRLQEVQELERQDLAAVLHDRVGQNLTGLNLNLQILQNQLEDNSGGEIRKRLEDSLKLVEETTHKIRDVMADLNPPVLDEYGLIAAIKWYCGDFTTRTGISAHVSGNNDEQRLASSVERILFRLVQEALMNVAKHAQARQVQVSVESSSDEIIVTVKDDGVGFDPQIVKEPKPEPHWGLLSMQRKAASIGADLTIDSSPGVGTTVCIKVRRQNVH